jgi:hypothetical protein
MQYLYDQLRSSKASGGPLSGVMPWNAALSSQWDTDGYGIKIDTYRCVGWWRAVHVCRQRVAVNVRQVVVPGERVYHHVLPQALASLPPRSAPLRLSVAGPPVARLQRPRPRRRRSSLQLRPAAQRHLLLTGRRRRKSMAPGRPSLAGGWWWSRRSSTRSGGRR